MPEINPGVGRAQYLDRNPLVVTKWYGGVIAPAGSTQRWIYTVPTGKKAYVQRAGSQIMRQTVAAPVGTETGTIVYTPNAGTAVQAAYAQLLNNAVGALDRDTFTGAGLINAADTLAAFTNSGSTGGTVEHSLELWAVEFDG